MNGDERPRLRRRAAVIRQALMMTPIALLCLAGVVYAGLQISNGDSGFFVLLTVSGVFTIVFGYLAVQSLRDLNAAPITTEGAITKKWSKASFIFFFMPNFYIACQGKIFSTSRRDHFGLIENDTVRVLHYPHSLTVELIERYDTGAKRWVPAFSEEEEMKRLIAQAERQRKR
jgi:hypothetical protein